MRLSDLSKSDLRHRLRESGLLLRTGPFTFRIFSPIERVADGIARLYSDYPLGVDGSFADFTLSIDRGRGWHRWIRLQARCLFDGLEVFEPLPQDQAFPLLEWSMNWCISGHAHRFLILHSAVIERHGFAAILPAPPGSGKSTLCAALIHSGWRLLSDELALISTTDGRIWPLCRPVSLKNGSIEVIRRFVPSAVFNSVSHATSKGSVTHMRVPQAHLDSAQVAARPRWLIFPRYAADAETTAMTPRSRASALIDLARNNFNFSVLGATGFQLLGDLVEASDCFDFRYSDLAGAVQSFDAMAEAS